MDLTNQARLIFCHDRYACEATGIAIGHVGDHEALCTLCVGERHCNARGVAMGGVLYTLADFASAVAANTQSLDTPDDPSLHWVSLNASIHYLAPAPLGAMLFAHASAVKHGRATALYRTTIESRDAHHERTVAVVDTTMVFIS